MDSMRFTGLGVDDRPVIGVMRHCERADYSFDVHSANDDIAENPYDPALSKTGCAHAHEVAEELAGSAPGKRIDIVVTSPYTRCLETACVIAKRLGKPLIVDPALQEVLARTLFNGSLDGSRPETSRPCDACVSFARERGVRCLTDEARPKDQDERAGEETTPFWETRPEPRWPESVPQAFRRYKDAFFDYANDGRSFFLVTHTLAVQAIAKKCMREEKALHHKHVENGFYFFCSPLSMDLDASTNSTSSFKIVDEFNVDLASMTVDLPRKDKRRARARMTDSGSFSLSSFDASGDLMREDVSAERDLTRSPYCDSTPEGSSPASVGQQRSRGSLLSRPVEVPEDASTRKVVSWTARLTGSAARLLARRKESKEKSRKNGETLLGTGDEKESVAART
jgi:broad specificity phosphatase PhoE